MWQMFPHFRLFVFLGPRLNFREINHCKTDAQTLLKRLLLGQNKVLTRVHRLNHSFVVPGSNGNNFKARHVKDSVSGTWSKSESFIHRRLTQIANIDRLTESLRVYVSSLLSGYDL